jgi:hypothetical protein
MGMFSALVDSFLVFVDVLSSQSLIVFGNSTWILASNR